MPYELDCSIKDIPFMECDILEPDEFCKLWRGIVYKDLDIIYLVQAETWELCIMSIIEFSRVLIGSR